MQMIESLLGNSALWLSLGVLAALFLLAKLSASLRVVVAPSEVHIVQTKKLTTSYGTGQKAGNIYWNWPSWVPIFGLTRTILPVYNFNRSLRGYEAYDKDRVPFLVDVTAFFRIRDTNIAAQRVGSIADLSKHLDDILGGAVRKVLATNDINQIMVDRATFGEQFTVEVAANLEGWGVETAKNIELMDIRDAQGSQVIHNIMAKKTSHIEMESRVEVANNQRQAEQAEIEAQQAVDIRSQEAAQAVGERTAQQERAVGIAREQAMQEIQQQAAITKQRQMEVLSVETQRQAEITREAEIVAAEQERQTTILVAEGQLKATELKSQGIKVEGEATAEAKRLAEMAIVSPQLELAKGTTNDPGYQNYLVRVREVEKDERVGIAQAQAMQNADIKIIANSDGIGAGMDGARALLSSRTGQNFGAVLEGLRNTPEGAAFLDRLQGRKDTNGAEKAN